MQAAERAIQANAAPAPPVITQASLVSAITSEGEAVDPDTCRNAAAVVESANSFQLDCLGLKRLRDWNTADMNIQVAGSSEGGVIDVVPSYTFRWRDPVGSGAYAAHRSSYLRLSAGIRAAVGEGSEDATFANLAESELTPGVAGLFGIEYGIHRRRLDRNQDPENPGLFESTQAAIRKARRECFAHHLAATAAGEAAPKAADGTALVPCEGQHFRSWLSDDARRDGYYRSIVKPLWGVDDVPAFFVGATGFYGRNQYEFFPLEDPANTGATLLTSLPTKFPDEGSTKLDRDVFSFGGYLGGGWGSATGVGFSAAASMTYRRLLAFPDSPRATEDQQVCPPSGTPIVRCFEVNVAPPYELEGWVAGLRLGLRLPHLGFIPSAAVEARFTYSLEEEQWGVRVPIYFISDTTGAPNGGVVVACTGEGRTAAGYELKGDCKASLFVSTSFKLHGF